MSWSQKQQTGDWYDQMTVLIGSAIRLLSGEAGVFVVANEAFDPQSSPEYVLYRVPEPALPLLLAAASEGTRPGSAHPLAINPLPPAGLLTVLPGLYDTDREQAQGTEAEGGEWEAGDVVHGEIVRRQFELF